MGAHQLIRCTTALPAREAKMLAAAGLGAFDDVIPVLSGSLSDHALIKDKGVAWRSRVKGHATAVQTGDRLYNFFADICHRK